MELSQVRDDVLQGLLGPIGHRGKVGLEGLRPLFDVFEFRLNGLPSPLPALGELAYRLNEIHHFDT